MRQFGVIKAWHIGLSLVFTVFLSSFILTGKRPAQDDTWQNCVVVCAYPDAAKVGVDILKKGGNAVDAAVAVQFALEVTFPEAGNIGGGGFMVFRSSKGEAATLDFREKAPALA
ncbi:MAG TPA: gamma-glutamyltransferase, partial [Mucilaginibacter sp.]|nr:gamma-glutamyltransferase [Mucilaginibacter sp.]